MRAQQRLDRVEDVLTLQELVLRWLADAQAYPTFAAYMGSLLDEPKSSYPSVRLPLRVAEAVEDQLRGRSPEYTSRQATKARFATAFLVILVGVIDAAVEEALRLEGLRAAGLTFWERALETQARLEGGEVALGERADWRRAAEVHRVELDSVEAARRLAEKRHYGGRSCLFQELETELASARQAAYRRSGITGDGPGSADTDPEALLADWELQALTEVFRGLGMGTATMSITDERLRRSLEVG